MGTDAKKRGLGRGLAALLGEAALPEGATGQGTGLNQDPAKARGDAGRQNEREVALDRLSPNPHQPRTQFDADSLSELADSIRVHGIIQPLVVTPALEQPGHFWIIAGERRWRAARLAALESVPVLVREATPQALTELALVENIQRADLNALEEAVAYQALMNDHGLTQAEVAERVGKSRSAVANAIRLLSLPEAAQQAIVAGRISAGHARALLALPDDGTILEVLDEIERGQLSVRQAEALIKQWSERPVAVVETPKAAPDRQLAAHVSHLENRFRAALGTKVNLNRNEDGSGRLVVHFYSDDDLEAIYRLIAGVGETDD
jgi:ParB family transcriptional regulator, chromosome partitioning protein